MATTTTATTTLGMKLDAMLQDVESIPSAYLYAIIVASSVLVSLFLMNQSPLPSRSSISSGTNADSPPSNFFQSTNTSNTTRSNNNSEQPQPKWHILKLLNYFAVVLFAMGAQRYVFQEQISLVSFLFGWGLFMCYFFGFFGISFVAADIEQAEQRSMETQQQQQPRAVVAATKKAVKSEDDSQSSTVCGQIPTTSSSSTTTPATANSTSTPPLPKVKSPSNIKELSNEQVAYMVQTQQIKDHQLEKLLDPHRAVVVRRMALEPNFPQSNALEKLPVEPSLDYNRVFGANCEVVVGYIPLPVGMVGPLTLNGEQVYVPMATTEGCLVASTNRGAKAISKGSGAVSTILRDGITRAPCVRMESAKEAAELKLWCEVPSNFSLLKQAFESTTSFGKLIKCDPTVAGKNVYLRLTCFSGDAMGMNMVSKGSLAVIELLQEAFPSLTLVALSGNMCTDKKAAAINWIEGRGKSVVVEATIPQAIVRSTLKTTVDAIVDTNINKNLIGSAMAGTIGGFNAHASNIVTAVFLATGQDPAQNVESSNCITLMEKTNDGDLWISCTMPSIEVGTVGGGTGLPAQRACLQAIGCQGGGKTPGEHAQKLAHVVAAATMAGELSLLAALAANTLVQAHMTHNRKKNT